MNKSCQRGFNLIELMVTVTLVGILLGIAIPSMRDFIRNNRLSGGVNDVLHSLNVARTEAIKRQQGNVVVCGTASPDVADAAKRCDYNNFTGWFVFQDTNGNWQHENAEPVLEQHTTLDSSVTVKLDANDAIVSYGPSGFAQPAGAKRPTATMVMCDSRGVHQVGNAATARALFITATGRARATSSWADVNGTAIGQVAGGNCP
jgi:type IV fimbrial biogenesis protein FimT